QESDSSIAIWALDARNPIWSGDYGVSIIDVPAMDNLRIHNQSGKFTLSRTPFACLEDYAEAHGDGEVALYKFYLPANEAITVLSDLDAMQIHHGTVYPETDGAALSALFRTVVRHKARLAANGNSIRV